MAPLMDAAMRRARVLARWLPVAALMAATSARAAPDYHQFVGGFVSAKGERAAVMGYPPGLEVWAWPVQLVSDLQVRFVEPGVVVPIAAQPLLRDVERTPTEVIRTYVGPDFRVREHLFVPRQQAGAVITWEVEGRPDVAIEVSFKPSLDLMWPGSLGGQEIGWDAARHGYVEREPLHRFSATIASPQIVAHDGTVNRARALSDRVTMRLQPVAHRAQLVMALDPAAGGDGAAAVVAGVDAAEADARDHAQGVLAQSLQVETPDAATNDALQSAELALDQAWACNDRLGCGELAGFGPSRPGRRPQYAWFFAGDGMIAAQGMIDSGQFARARAELEFVTRYQDPRTGMIWHEMSQSAGLIDWARYPYMFVHVDVTFQYLAQVAAYVKASGDDGFVRAHWQALAAAWRYCLSTIDGPSGLPRIPAGKEGQDEQHPLRDDIRLSSAWVDTADGMAALARVHGDGALAAVAAKAAARARVAIAAQDWDAAHAFWLEGHLGDGSPVFSQRSDAIGTLDQHIFDAAQTKAVLDRLGSGDFVTDWGMRSLSAADPEFDPNAYALGSVWALGTSGAAQVFWHHGRDDAAWRLWQGLVAWNTLDSAGHLHEVLAGDFAHPDIESVPEQTWSSAGLISAAVHGLLGLEVDAARREVWWAPHFPAGWHHVVLRNVPVGAGSRIAMTIDNDMVAIENPGAPVRMHLGAAGTEVTVATGTTRLRWR